jgi:hypothetical protein
MRRAIARCDNAFHWAIALCLFAAPLSGCRNTESPEESSLTTTPVFKAGDRLIFDGWTTNLYGYTLDTSKARHTWDVLTVTASAGGFNDVIMVREEILHLKTSATAVDTFLLRVTSEGLLLRYGFLAELVKQRESRVIPERWDTLAVLNASVWTVGPLDSAGRTSVTASAPPQDDYFNVEVDGLSSIFSARRVEMESDQLEYALWVSASPPCFPRFEEGPSPFSEVWKGSLLVLRQLQLAPR